MVGGGEESGTKGFKRAPLQSVLQIHPLSSAVWNDPLCVFVPSVWVGQFCIHSITIPVWPAASISSSFLCRATPLFMSGLQPFSSGCAAKLVFLSGIPKADGISTVWLQAVIRAGLRMLLVSEEQTSWHFTREQPVFSLPLEINYERHMWKLHFTWKMLH